LEQLLGDSCYLKVTSTLQNGRHLEPKFEGYVLKVDVLFRFQWRMYIPKEGYI